MITALYERLSRDDDLEGESNSISNQKRQLEDYARSQGFLNPVHFTDDGISEDFAKQLAKLLGCKVNTICTIEKRKETFAFESNHKIKRTLRVILASAKKQRIIADNYASSDFINFPKRPPHEIPKNVCIWAFVDVLHPTLSHVVPRKNPRP